jgi:hypothetical protein
MIQDLDDTLKTLLIQKVPIDNTAIDIKFEMPSQDWETKLQKPTINLFLYDIRENLELRSNEKFLTRQGVIGTENIAPVRMDLTYMITAWTKEIADEHRLLGNILKTLLRYPILPPEVFQGAIANQSLPLRAWVTQPEQTPKVWDFWGAMNGRLKAGLSYMVTIAIEPFEPFEVNFVTERIIKLEQLNVQE